MSTDAAPSDDPSSLGAASASAPRPYVGDREASDPGAVVDPGLVLFGDREGLARSFAELLATSAVERGLVGPREVPRIWDRHVVNCAVLASSIARGARLADVGSGAGLPGLVLAIARPDLSITLVEPLLRRVTWLESTVEDLSLTNVSVVRSRAEDLPAAMRDFDVVTARAVAPLPRLLAWCLPLLRVGGEFLALKGESVAAELSEAEPALRRLGARSWSISVLGEGVVHPPARVVRVVAGAGPTSLTSARKGGRGRR